MKYLKYYCTCAFLLPAIAGSAQETNLNKSCYTLFNPTPTNQMRAFETDRPSKTDVPFTVDAGHFQLETDIANFTHNEQSGVRTQTLELGSNMNLKLGLLNNVDFQVILGNYVNQQITDQTTHTSIHNIGYGDITTRLKLNLFGNDGGTYALALLPYLKIPTDTGGVGNHSFEGGLNVPFAANLPKGFTLNAETGVGFFRDSGNNSGYHAAFNNSVILYHAIYKNLSGYGEFFSSVSTRSQDSWVGTADFGLIYQLTPNIALDVDTAIGLTQNADDYNVFGGFAVRF